MKAASWYDCVKGRQNGRSGRADDGWCSGAAAETRGSTASAFLELFFDLVFVLALFRVSQGLLEHLTWSGAFQTLVLLLALWWVWVHTAGAADMLDPRRAPIQLLVIATMFGTLLMAAAAPEAFHERGLFFAGAYVAIHVGRSAFIVAVVRDDEVRRFYLRLLFWFGVSAVPWIAGAAAHDTARAVLWALALAVEYTAVALRYPTPWLGRARAAEFAISGEHLGERFRQFFIIALGELILSTGLAFGNGGFEADRSAAVVVAFATIVLLWRIYIYRAGELLDTALAAAPDPLRVGIPSVYSHLAMIAGIVAIAVGDELVIVHPFGHNQPAWIAVILGGPGLFLAGRALFEYAVFRRVSWDRPIGVLVLAVISPVMILVPPLGVATAAVIVLAGVAVADAIRARRHPRELPSRPG
ncbi:low temperature requirement protein A [Micromonospora sp. H33]|uniref:low temperature requirement protein A n=1 Tax=Micromonospora sp. H33 TaxID=3452215 RepID=UPI003F89DBF0